MPNVLIIQLKRFKYISDKCKKISFSVNIPFDINLNFLLYNKKSYQNSTCYTLNSLIVHVGSGIQHGHYFSLIKNKDKWYKVDDDKVQEIDLSTVIDNMGNPDEDNPYNDTTCAYLLFYVRQM